MELKVLFLQPHIDTYLVNTPQALTTTELLSVKVGSCLDLHLGSKLGKTSYLFKPSTVPETK